MPSTSDISGNNASSIKPSRIDIKRFSMRLPEEEWKKLLEDAKKRDDFVQTGLEPTCTGNTLFVSKTKDLLKQ